MMKSRRVFAAVVAALMLACQEEGPMGIQGPQGEQGPPGPEGPAGAGFVVLAATGQLDADGEGAVRFEDASIESAIVNCWVSDSASGPWLKVATSVGGSSLSCGARNDGPDLLVGFIGFPARWYALATVAKPAE